MAQATTVRIGTRGSRLALAQSTMVARALEGANPGLRAELVEIATSGDKSRTAPLPSIGGKGLFTREIEQRLLAGEIHLAVHSLKDLPTDLPEGLAILAVPQRAPANDALVSPGGLSLAELPAGSRVGTSSPRRAAQLLARRPDIQVVPIRGNLDTRLRKLQAGDYDAIVVAVAGLERLGLWDERCRVLSFDEMLPAPGQGALAVEGPAHVPWLRRVAAAIDHPPTALATRLERDVLKALGGGCAVPVGVYAEARGTEVQVRAVVASEDGRRVCRAEKVVPTGEAEGLARAVADELLRRGAGEILRRRG